MTDSNAISPLRTAQVRLSMLLLLAGGAGCDVDPEMPGEEGTTGDMSPTADSPPPSTTGQPDETTEGEDSSDDEESRGSTEGSTEGSTTGAATEGTEGTSGVQTTEGTETSESDGSGGDACGNGVLDAEESCDGEDLGAEDCATQGYAGGELGCHDDCTLDTSACLESVCGNDLIEGSEACDGEALAGEDCLSLGFDDGVLACGDDCSLDLSGCIMFSCGNDMVEAREACDGEDLAGEDCGSQGFDGGALDCTDGCVAFDTSGCYACGDGELGGPETCDGDELGEADCVSLGFDGGELACAADCGGFDTAGCYSCGDSAIEGPETCDGDELGGADCVSLGFDGGELACAANCGGYDTSGCFNNVCGNGVIEGEEACDGAELGGADCGSQGFIDGELTCADDCTFDTSACISACGNGLLDEGEVCDGPELAEADCASQGLLGGQLGCSSDCAAFDTTQCYDEQLTFCSSPGTQIGPDGGTLTQDIVAAIGSGQALADVNVILDVSHTFTGDLDVEISHVASGTTVQLFDQSCSGADDILATFDQQAASGVDCGLGSPIGQGTFVLPVGDLGAFNGLGDGTGDWQLNILDNLFGDQGTLNEWCVVLGTNANAPFCGDAVAEQTETCDTTALLETRCEDLGFAGGSLDCDLACGFDTGDCSNDVITACGAPEVTYNEDVPVVSTITIPPGGTIADLDVFIDTTHTYPGDLEITLTHDTTGTSVSLFSNRCGGTDDIIAFFNDESPRELDCIAPVGVEGNLPPEAPLAGFDGEALDGDWTLSVIDELSGDSGTFHEWCVYITPEAPPEI